MLAIHFRECICIRVVGWLREDHVLKQFSHSVTLWVSLDNDHLFFFALEFSCYILMLFYLSQCLFFPTISITSFNLVWYKILV
ncbi:hypothetical protein MtrunA17_Chr5g0409551 [Medicago truncatula]|uniref:Transmembrane protein n=1 Tax=Medicago truncatula TaxID=3880 RepID=A0A396HTG4_MEDTR|nr:hypothetical protein MtrunA17_Chr5g0409551 [Medicago truncatula]